MRQATWKGRVAKVAGIAVVVAAIGLGGRGLYSELRWKQFRVVEQGSLYRSGQLTDRQLRQAIEGLGLRTVVCLDPDQVDRERALCRSYGVRFCDLPMPASGVGQPEDFVRFLEIASDPSARPLLVHCRAGVARTGAAVALYRMARQGWSLERAIEELRSFERQGRCEPALRRHIQCVYEDHAKSRRDPTVRSAHRVDTMP